MTEIWKDIKGFEGIYRISSLGKVESLDRLMRNASGGLSKFRGKILKSQHTKDGYLCVRLKKNFKINFTIHRLAALAFIPNPENKDTVNHKNGIKTDNRVENLEWATRSENQHHAFSTGLRSHKGQKSPTSILTESQAIEIKYGYKDLKQYQIAKIYNINKNTVSDIRTGKKWRHI